MYDIIRDNKDGLYHLMRCSFGSLLVEKLDKKLVAELFDHEEDESTWVIMDDLHSQVATAMVGEQARCTIHVVNVPAVTQITEESQKDVINIFTAAMLSREDAQPAERSNPRDSIQMQRVVRVHAIATVRRDRISS
jgi:hypothetical protein